MSIIVVSLPYTAYLWAALIALYGSPCLRPGNSTSNPVTTSGSIADKINNRCIRYKLYILNWNNFCPKPKL